MEQLSQTAWDVSRRSSDAYPSLDLRCASQPDMLLAERLYYADAYVRSFTARVLGYAEINGQPALALDQTAFYPEGGGQPADRGLLNGVPVQDVQIHDHTVWHILESSSKETWPQPNDHVFGEIDWTRRFDHMQQHLGSHLLAAAFQKVANVQAISFHLGIHTTTIDLDTPVLHADQVAAAENLVNQIIWEDHPVLARFVSPGELVALPIDRIPPVSGAIRIVSVADFDHSCCGGTHPRTTGAVGLVAVKGWERKKGGVRVTFVCGERTLRTYRHINGIVNRSAVALSVGTDQLEEALRHLRNSHDAARKELEQQHAQALDAEAQRLLQTAAGSGPARIVCQVLDRKSASELRGLALRVAAQKGGVALLGAITDRVHLVVACANDLGLNAQVILATALPLIDGRGGGNATLAQGGGPGLAGLADALTVMHGSVAEHLA